MSANLHETIGRKQVEIEDLQRVLSQTLGLLRELKNGRVTIDRVEVLDGGWKILPEKPPEKPAGEAAAAVSGAVESPPAGS